MNASFLQELLNTIAERGRALLPARLFGGASSETIADLARELLSGRGEASGVAIAHEVIERYSRLGGEEKVAFFKYLADELKPDAEAVERAARGYLASPGEATVAALQAAVTSPRQELFHRLNLSPGATAAIVDMRRDLLEAIEGGVELGAVDADLRRLLKSWFNRGFLVLKRIDWQTPAAILEKIIRYEAVHAIRSWDDLRTRLDPADRRCFAFFHPALVDEPLIFVEVALAESIPSAIAPVLARHDALEADDKPTTAVFYSISNCQPGLKGISFGHFLIKQVVEELKRETPSLATFVTLSPVPGLASWLDSLVPDERAGILDDKDWLLVDSMIGRGAEGAAQYPEGERVALLALAAHYFLREKSGDGKPRDPVARFHLGNGASLARLNWLADTSEKGWSEAFGLMVNYRYDLDEIERNHESYANDGTVVAHKAVRALLKPQPKPIDAGAARLTRPLLGSPRAPRRGTARSAEKGAGAGD